METKELVVQAECGACGGTGLYQGLAEAHRAGVAVVCRACNGTGARDLRYVPFTARKPRPGVTAVYRSAGTLIVGPIGPTGAPITYAEFQAGKLP